MSRCARGRLTLQDRTKISEVTGNPENPPSGREPNMIRRTFESRRCVEHESRPPRHDRDARRSRRRTARRGSGGPEPVPSLPQCSPLACRKPPGPPSSRCRPFSSTPRSPTVRESPEARPGGESIELDSAYIREPTGPRAEVEAPTTRSRCSPVDAPRSARGCRRARTRRVTSPRQSAREHEATPSVPGASRELANAPLSRHDEDPACQDPSCRLAALSARSHEVDSRTRHRSPLASHEAVGTVVLAAAPRSSGDRPRRR